VEKAVKVRTLAADDIPRVVAIQGRSPEASQWSQPDYERVARGEMRGWVAEIGEVQGFLIARQVLDEMEILNLAVNPALRLRGIGSALLKSAMDWGTSKKAARAFLEVRASNETAIQFYRAHGFEIAGRRKNYYADPVEDAFVLTRSLSASSNAVASRK
jgi:[ribosomal protein S18]-alanine N-acetyltransferase